MKSISLLTFSSFCLLHLIHGQQSTPPSNNQDEATLQILKIFLQTQKSIEDKILYFTTNPDFQNNYMITASLNNFRISLFNLTDTLQTSSTLLEFSDQLNSSEITQSLQLLNVHLNPNPDDSLIYSDFWTTQLDQLGQFQSDNLEENSEIPTDSKWIESFQNFTDFLNTTSYHSAIVLNNQVRSLTGIIAGEFLDDGRKLAVLIPKKKEQVKEANLAMALKFEVEQEAHEIILKFLHRNFLARSHSLYKLVEGELRSEESVQRFVERVLEYKEKYGGSIENLERLAKDFRGLDSGEDVEHFEGQDLEIKILEDFGQNSSPFRREEWIEEFGKVQEFYERKLKEMEERGKERRRWKSTKEYEKLMVAGEKRRRRIEDSEEDVVGSYGVECTGKCQKNDKDYYWCSNESTWDYCSILKGYDYTNKTCVDKCGRKGYSYKWCLVEGGSWGYCS